MMWGCSGRSKYKDQNGDGKITTADRTVIGNAMPKWFGGITNSFSFKGIDFSFMLQYSYGNDVFNATRQFATGSQDQRYNMLAEVADRWSPTNAIQQSTLNERVCKGRRVLTLRRRRFVPTTEEHDIRIQPAEKMD